MTTTNEAPPKDCKTCVHMATHEKCRTCDHDSLSNWEFGDWLARRVEYEKAGRCQIVIGNQGEAEVNAKDSPRQTSKHLHYVAEQCGYMCGWLHRVFEGKQIGLNIYTTEGQFWIYWDTTDPDEPGKLSHINRVVTDRNGENEREVQSWPTPTPENWEVLWA